ncbi:MAG: hypothetical protein WAV98_00295 [Minisyncoccia bacterium]
MPLILAVVFSIVGFIVFASTASANVISDKIAENLNLTITSSELYGIEDIPSDIAPDQYGIILNEIITNAGVTEALDSIKEAIPAKASADNNYNSAAATLSLGACNVTESPTCWNAIPTEKTARDKANADYDIAVETLRKALVLARKSQEGSIKTAQAENLVANNANIANTQITTGTEKISTGFQGQAQTDINAQEMKAVNQADVDASNQKKITAREWNKTEEESVTIPSMCSFGFPKVLGGSGEPMNLTGCVADLVYNVIYVPSSQVLRGVGIIFDTMLMLSIDNSEGMVVPDFINSAWTVVRDFSNMLFIFILLYTGIMTMFGSADWRKVVLQVVVIALLINFSLFFTKVVIDAGNVLAVGIRSAISTGGPNGSVSEGLVGSFSPQKFLTSASKGNQSKPDGGAAIVVFIVAIIVNLFAAWILFKAALLFMGRLLAFWFLMIVSPFAFISIALPKGNKFYDWMDTLLGQVFVAPIFLFFIYLIIMVIQSGNGILSHFSSTEDMGWFASLLGPAMVATLLVLALKKALEFAEGMAGDFGKMGSQALSGAISGAAMVATGGAMMAGGIGRQTLGRYGASQLAKGGKTEAELLQMSSEDRAKYESVQSRNRSWAKSNFDVRNVVGGKDSVFGKTVGGAIDKKIGKGTAGSSREQIEQSKIQKELKASEKGQLSTFEENAIRSNPNLVKEAVANNILGSQQEEAKAEDTLRTEKAILVATEKANKASVDAIKEMTAAYKDAEARAERDKGSSYEAESSAAAAEYKGKLDVAQKTHDGSPATKAVKDASEKVRTSEAALKVANAKTEVAKKLSEKTAEEQTTWVVKNENSKQTEVSAKKAEAEGRHVTAAKIRKGEKGEKSFTDQLKELADKAAKQEQGSEPTQAKPKAEPAAEAKH